MIFAVDVEAAQRMLRTGRLVASWLTAARSAAAALVPVGASCSSASGSRDWVARGRVRQQIALIRTAGASDDGNGRARHLRRPT